jgi:radical SAM superfamily enzyme YgiQ (UPF0313 family)
MKAVLFALNSSYVHTNLAVRCLKKALVSAGVETVIIERSLKDKRDDVLYDLYAENAGIYGFSAYIWNISEMLKYASLLRLLRPECKIVFGGPEVSFVGEEFFSVYPYVDHIIRGEGEGALADLCINGSDKRIIDGGVYSGFIGAGTMYDSAPHGSIVYYESSRGCPYNCSFCLSSLTKGVRAKSVETTLTELRNFEQISDKIKIVKFVDRTFNFDRERAKSIWRAISGSDFRLKYHFEICAGLLDDESIEILNGMPHDKIQLEIGIQSTNNATLRACSRHGDISVILENTRRLHSAGNIHIHCDLIAGLPYESYSSFAESYDAVHPLCDKLQLGFLKLLRGSHLREESEFHGIVCSPEAPYTILYNNYIGYEELNRLRRIAAMTERYEGGGFVNTMKYIFNNISSPFRFYEGMEKTFKDYFSSVSQNKARELLYIYGSDYVDRNILSAYMRFDYLLFESGRYPAYLHENYDRTITEKVKREFIAECKLKNLPVHIPSLEAHIFGFDSDKVYLIDRANSVYYIRSIV